MRGFLSGVIWGVVVVCGSIVALSLMSPVAPRPDVASDMADQGISAPAQTEAEAPGAATADPDLVESAPKAPTASGEDLDTLEPMAQADTTPGVKPEVTDSTASPDVPVQSEDTDTGAISPLSEAPAAPTPATQPTEPSETTPPEVNAALDRPSVQEETGALDTAPEARALAPERPLDTSGQPQPAAAAEPVAEPAAEAAPEIATSPVTPTEPEVAPEATSEAPKETGESEVATAVDKAPVPSATAETPVDTDQVEEKRPPAPVATEQTGQPPVSEPTPESTRSTDVAIAALPQVTPETESDTTPPNATADEVIPEDEDAPRIAGLPQTQAPENTELRPTIGQRVVPLTERNSTASPDSSDAAAASPGSARPLDRFAAPFRNDTDRPLLSIVLIDDAQSIGVEALRDFPYPLSFAVDPAAPDAAAKMARHRAAGFEVLALVDLPRAGTAQDAEIALTAGFDRLSEAVGLLEGTGTGIQGNRNLSDQVTAFLGATGRGLITQGSGLNTVPKLAVRDGVPAAPIFRDFDGAGQTPTVMRRFLDQAAFRARQEGAVVMLGRVRPDTISALLIWGLQDRAEEVALAPVSAVLKDSVEAE